MPIERLTAMTRPKWIKSIPIPVTRQEVLENEIVMKTDAVKNNKIVYLTPDVWYLAEG